MFQRYILLAAIVTVGLLDLGFTTYMSHQDLFDSSQNLISQVNQLIVTPDLTPKAPLPDLDQDSISPAAISNGTKIGIRNIKLVSLARINRRPRSRTSIAAVTVPAKFSQPVSVCRVVTYPFVGDEYVVQVTDETACMTQIASRYRRDHLVAQVIPRRSRL